MCFNHENLIAAGEPPSGGKQDYVKRRGNESSYQHAEAMLCTHSTSTCHGPIFSIRYRQKRREEKSFHPLQFASTRECATSLKIPTPFGFFWVGSSTWACGGGLIFFYFLFLLSHLLDHVGLWDLLLVPHWWKKKYIVIQPNQN
jgi:hypothetical protein